MRPLSTLFVLLAGWVNVTTVSAATSAESPSASFTAEQFHAMVTADADAAKQKYGDKVIELTGKIMSMGVYSDSVALVTLDGNKAACFVSDPQPWLHFGEGQKVQVRGTYSRRIVGVGLERCRLTAVDESPLIHRSAKELAAEFKKDLSTASDKYDKQQFVVTGKVARIERDKLGPTEIFFEGAEGVSVSCAFAYDLERRLRDVKEGQQFCCYGTFLKIFGSKEEVGLISGLPIEMPAESEVERPADPFAGGSDPKARVWTNRSGKTVEAEFVSISGDTVRIKRESDGKLFDVPLDTLTDADQAYARGQEPVAIPKLVEPLPEAEESDRYTLVRSPDNAVTIVTATNSKMNRVGGRSSIPQSAGTIEEVLKGMDEAIAEMESLGMSWSREDWFDPKEKIYATALKNHYQGKEYRMFVFSNSPDFEYGAVVVHPDRIYRKDDWLVVPMRKIDMKYTDP